MAVRPDYMVGTITLTSGSRNFTTSGASLQSANVQAGDAILTAGGLMLIIDTITGQNAGTLRHNSPIAANNVQLAIRFQSDGSRYPGAVRDFIGRWGQTGNLDAIAGLATFKDMLAYFTGAGTADVTALTAWARTLLAAANGEKAYEALGVVPDSAFPNRLRSNGGNTRTDPDNITESGWHRIAGGSPNMPTAGTFILFHLTWSNNQARQLCYSHSDISHAYERVNVLGTWSPWLRSAPPQRGNNANGEFVRLADGTQFCTTVVSFDTSIDQTWGSGFMSESFGGVFPASFISLPAISITAASQSCMNAAASTNNYSFRFWSSLARSVESRRVRVQATGRWY